MRREWGAELAFEMHLKRTQLRTSKNSEHFFFNSTISIMLRYNFVSSRRNVNDVIEKENEKLYIYTDSLNKLFSELFC